ncbi:MAG: hypothetical protein M3323_02510 [Actinomycetota bacterium]|nr:hypothetical protein [Actinomycetota bacterium]
MFAFGGLELVVMPLALIGVVLLGIVALAGSRGEPDPHGHRPRTLYLSLVSFVAIFTLLFAIASTTSALANMIFVEIEGTSINCGEDPLHPECQTGPVRYVNVFDESSVEAQEAARARDAFNGIALALAATGVLLLHRGRHRELLGDATFVSSPGARAHNAYLYAVSFVAMIVLLAAAATALFALARVAVPGVVSDTGSGAERDAGLVQLVSSLVTGGAAWFLYVTHWRETRRRPAA